MKKKIVPISIILLFSIIMWGSISLSGEFVSTVKVPVTLFDLPKNYTKGSISEKEVYLRVRAKGWELAKLSLGGSEEFLVSARRMSGTHRVNLRDELENNTWLTSTFRVLEIAPSNIEFEVDRIVTKTVFVKYDIQVDFKEGFGIASEILITPAQVEISGSANQLRHVDTVTTEFKELKDLSEPVSVTLNLKEIEGATLSENKCKLEFDVQKIVDKSFDDINIEVRNVPSSKELILFPGKISIVLKGGISKLGRLTKDSIQAYVDYWTVLRNEDEGVEPVVKIPFSTSLVDIKPKKLEFVIKQY
jgi:YbbR domain-containing protein